MRKKPILVVAFLLMLYITPMIFISSYVRVAIPAAQNMSKDFSVSTDGENWLSGWNYRQQLSITGQVGAGTGYQVPLFISHGDSVPVSFTYASSVGPYNASQSVACNGSHFWTTSGGSGSPADNSYLTGYDSDWTQLVGRDCDADGPADMMQINGVQEKDGVLYVTANNWTDGTENPIGYVYEYDPDTLEYSTYHTLDNSSDLPHEHFAEGLDWHNGYWWVVWHDWTYITKYDSSWNWVADYELTYSGNGHYYQGIMWYGDYVYVNIHSSGAPIKLDCFFWNGTGFEENRRMSQVTVTATQGMALNKTDMKTVYWAERGGADDMKVTITTMENITGDNFLTLGGHSQPDLDDIRFTAADGNTSLYYWRDDSIISGFEKFWVVVSADLGSNQVIYCYYGNSTVSTVSNGPYTFTIFDDFNRADNDTVGGTWTDDAGSGDNDISSNTLKVNQSQHYYSHVEQGAGFLTRFAFEVRINCHSDIGSTWHPSLWVYWDSYSWVSIGPRMDGSQDKHHGYTNDGGTVTNQYGDSSTADTWYYYRIMVDTNVHVQESTDGSTWSDVYDIARSANWAGVPSLVILGKGHSVNAGSYPNADLDNDGGVSGDTNQISYYDNVFVRKCLETEVTHPIAGEEETILAWSVINTVIVFFTVPLFTGSFDALLIFLGLVMIPASTLYFVKGGKDEMSSDKLFYCLIAFVIGWALLLGGIMP